MFILGSPILFMLVGLLCVFLYTSRETRRSAGKLLAGGAMMGIVAAFMLAVIFVILVGGWKMAQREDRTLPATTAEEVVQPPQPPQPPTRPRAFNEPLIVLNDEAKEPQTTATEPKEESTSNGKKTAEQSTEEPVDKEPPDAKPAAVANVAKSPSGDAPPAWVGRGPFREGDVYMVPLTLDPGPTRQLCEEELLLPAVMEEIKAYASEKLGPGAARGAWLPLEYIRGRMIGDDLWVEPVKVDSFSELDQKLGREIWGDAANASTDNWVRLHALVKFDGDVQRRIEQRWIGALRFERLQGAGALIVVALLALASLYATMRFDLATAGAYRNRLRAAALAVIIAVILVVVLTK